MTSASTNPVSEYLYVLHAWLEEAERTGRIQSAGSLEVYRAMWTAFANWALGKDLSLSQITAADIADYLTERGGQHELTSRYAWRLANLIDRVLAHDARQSGRAKSLAAVEFLHQHPAIRFANSRQEMELPECLDAAEARQLVAFLNEPRRSTTFTTWQEARNRAAVAVMLGAGLTPAEVQRLTLEDVVSDRANHQPWKLRVAGSSKAKARQAPCAKWTGQVLNHWLTVRQAQSIPGDWLFPSTKSSGKQIGKVALYNATNQVLSAAGLAPGQGGSFKLRHTFAVRQLKRGHSLSDIAKWLGIEPMQAQRYSLIISAPISIEYGVGRIDPLCVH